MALRARDIMTTRVRTVHPDTTFADLERFLASERISGAPVVQEGRVVGVISRADILRKLADEQTVADLTVSFYTHPFDEEVSPQERLSRQSAAVAKRMAQLHVRDAMTETVLAVFPDDLVEEVARQMTRHGVHRILVREGDDLVGLISTLDIVRVVAEKGIADG